VSGADFCFSPDALWLLGFGLPGAIFAARLGTPAWHKATWLFGVAMSLLGLSASLAFKMPLVFLWLGRS
jgi:hypothetical protein